jgi:hypothetical protein
MSCNRTGLRKQGRKTYSLARNINPVYQYISNQNIEIENLIVEVYESDFREIAFSSTFTGVPSVVANFMKEPGDPNVSVYVETATSTKTVIRMSAPVSGKIHVHAVYIEN